MTAALRGIVVGVLAALLTVVVGAPSAGADTWPWPLTPTPRLVRPFKAPASEYGAGHRGVDLAGTAGQPVLAATSGRVSFASQVAGRGVVVVRYGVLRITYEPVTAGVGMGDVVRAGAVIGSLGLAGSHCWPAACLHVGVRRGETYLDPMRWFGPLRVRLKPFAGADAAPALGPIAAAPAHPPGLADSARSDRPKSDSWIRATGMAAGAGAAAATAIVAGIGTRRRRQARG